MITLYSYWRSSASFRLRIGLGLKGLAYTYRAVNIAPSVNDQMKETFRALNPQMRVPYVEIERDGKTVKLAQSGAILEYLDEDMPGPKLLPSAPDARARVRQYVGIIGCDIQPFNNVATLQYLRNQMGQDEQAVSAWYGHWIELGFTALEDLLKDSKMRGRFACGDEPGLTECYLIPQLWNARRFDCALEGFPTLLAIEEAALAIDAVRAALPEAQPDAPVAD